MAADPLTVEIQEAAIKAAARVLMGAALDLLQQDPHSWSDRPCQTCRTIVTLLGRNFGCYTFMQRKRDSVQTR